MLLCHNVRTFKDPVKTKQVLFYHLREEDKAILNFCKKWNYIFEASIKNQNSIFYLIRKSKFIL